MEIAALGPTISTGCVRALAPERRARASAGPFATNLTTASACRGLERIRGTVTRTSRSRQCAAR